MAFENLLALAAEGDRTVLAEQAVKYPWIKERIDLGDQVYELKPRLKKLSGTEAGQDFESNPGLAIQELESWRDWKANKWPTWDEENRQAKAALKEAQDKITAYEAGEIDMTPEQIDELIDKRIAARGLVAATDVDARLQAYEKDKFTPGVTSMVNGLTNRFEEVYTALTPTIVRHEKEYGEVLNPGDVFKFMKEKGIADPNKAYEEFTAPKRAEKMQLQHVADVEKARKEGLAEGQRAAAASSGRAMPVGGGNTAPVGPLVSRFRQKFAEKLAAGQTSADAAPLGKGIIAHAAAQRHFDKELAGGQP